MVCFCCCRVKFNVKINKEYVGAPDFILRILITILQLGAWVTIATVAKYGNSKLLTPTLASIRDAFLFISVYGFVTSLVTFCLALFNVAKRTSKIWTNMNCFFDLILSLAMFAISIAASVGESKSKSIQFAVNKGSFITAAFFGYTLTALYATDFMYHGKLCCF